MTNHKLIPALLSAAIIASASTAFAQAAVDAPSTGAHQMQTEAPKVPGVTTTDAIPGEHNAMPAISTPDTGVQPPVTITPVPMNMDMSAPAAVVLEIPKADGTIIDKLINHHNNKEVEDIVAMFSKDGFIKVRNNGNVLKNAEDLRKELVDFFAGDKKHTFTSQVDMIKDVAPGVAIIGGYYNMFEEGNTTHPVAKMYGITVVKYEDNAWKIVASEATDLPKPASEVETAATTSGGGFKMAIIALIGIAIGFLGARFMPKKAPTE